MESIKVGNGYRRAFMTEILKNAYAKEGRYLAKWGGINYARLLGISIVVAKS
jgi:hypothetical protein